MTSRSHSYFEPSLTPADPRTSAYYNGFASPRPQSNPSASASALVPRSDNGFSGSLSARGLYDVSSASVPRSPAGGYLQTSSSASFARSTTPPPMGGISLAAYMPPMRSASPVLGNGYERSISAPLMPSAARDLRQSTSSYPLPTTPYLQYEPQQQQALSHSPYHASSATTSAYFQSSQPRSQSPFRVSQSGGWVGAGDFSYAPIAERVAEHHHQRFLQPRIVVDRYGLDGNSSSGRMIVGMGGDDRRLIMEQHQREYLMHQAGGGVRRPVLYMSGGSQPSRAVLLFCLFANIDVEERHIDILKGEHKSDPFLRINPNGQLPALEDNGFCLSESNTIMRYLSDKYCAQDHWYPHELQRRTRINEYFDWHHTHLRKATLLFIFNKIACPLLSQPADLAKLREGVELFQKELAFVNRHFFANQRFVTGDTPTLADIACYVEIQQLAAFPEHFNLNSFPHVQRWMREFEAINPDKLRRVNTGWEELLARYRQLQYQQQQHSAPQTPPPAPPPQAVPATTSQAPPMSTPSIPLTNTHANLNSGPKPNPPTPPPPPPPPPK